MIPTNLSNVLIDSHQMKILNHKKYSDNKHTPNSNTLHGYFSKNDILLCTNNLLSNKSYIFLNYLTPVIVGYFLS